MFKTTVARIEAPNGDKRFLGMINVEVFNDDFYCEYVIDGGAIVWQDFQHDNPEADAAAFEAAKKFEEAA